LQATDQDVGFKPLFLKVNSNFSAAKEVKKTQKATTAKKAAPAAKPAAKAPKAPKAAKPMQKAAPRVGGKR
jgi:hypothetical protein